MSWEDILKVKFDPYMLSGGNDDSASQSHPKALPPKPDDEWEHARTFTTAATNFINAFKKHQQEVTEVFDAWDSSRTIPNENVAYRIAQTQIDKLREHQLITEQYFVTLQQSGWFGP